MSPSTKREIRPTSRLSCMFQLYQRIWSRSARSWNKACKVDSTMVAAFIKKEGRIIARGRREGRMFIIDAHKMKSAMFAKGHKVDADIELWHKRICHINLQKLKGMQSKGVVIRLPTFTEKEITCVCEACQFGKQDWQPFPKERNMSKWILDVIHSDVWWPAQTATFGGYRYYMTFIDDFSRHTKIFPTRQKSEVFSRFQKFKYEVKKTTDRHIRCLPSDGGKEYFSDAFTTYLQQEGVRQEFTCRLTLSPIHVVWWRCYQFSFVDLDIENILSIIITRYQYIIVDLDSYIFFLFSFYHHSFR